MLSSDTMISPVFWVYLTELSVDNCQIDGTCFLFHFEHLLVDCKGTRRVHSGGIISLSNPAAHEHGFYV